MTTVAALQLRSVSKRFGGMAAISTLSLDVFAGEVHALIGPNGAGKTTAINIATGFYTPDSGAVLLRGEDVTRKGVHSRAALGLSRTFQGARPFPKMHVRDNVRVAVQQRFAAARETPRKKQIDTETDDLVARAGLSDCADEMANAIPYGRQKQLELVRAIGFAQGTLLLDEPTAGLSDVDIDLCLDLVRSIRSRTAILIVEHNMDVVMSFSDRITVIDAGKWLATGNPAEIQRDANVINAYLGG